MSTQPERKSTKSVHTPGPWSAHKSRGLNSYEIRGGSAYLADVWGVDTPVPNGVAPGAVKANSLLIAAAPDMKDALQAIAEFSELDGSPFALSAAKTARAAIAKAEGK